MVDFYESPFDVNPYDTETAGVRRRSGRAVGPAPVIPETRSRDPLEGQWLAETARAHATGTVNDLTNGVEFLARGLAGDESGRQAAAEEYLEQARITRGLGPEIQSFDDADAAGGGVGNYAKSLAFMGAGLVPDVAMAMTGVGLGGTVARRATRKGIQGAIADRIEQRAARRALQEPAGRVAAQAAQEAAQAAPDAVSAVSNATRVAARQASEDARKAAMAQAAALAGRTPRLVQAVEEAGKWGGRVGGTAAAVPTLNGEANAEKAADAETTQSDMWKLAAGTTAAAATQVIPIERFLGRFGKEAADEVAGKARGLLGRTGKEAATQGALEGGQEVVQQALQNAGHAWVEENLDALVGPEAFQEYLVSLIAGGALGAGMGGGGELGRGAAGAVGRGIDWIKDKTGAGYQAVRERVAKAAEARRAQRRPGDPVEPDGSVKATFESKLDDLTQNDEIDTDTDDLLDTIERLFADHAKGDFQPLTEPRARAQSNPLLQDMPPLQRVLAAHLKEAVTTPESVAQIRPWIESASKLFSNDALTDADRGNIDRLRELIPRDVKVWEAAGPDFAELTRRAGELKNSQVAEVADEQKAELGFATGAAPADGRTRPSKMSDSAPNVDSMTGTLGTLSGTTGAAEAAKNTPMEVLASTPRDSAAYEGAKRKAQQWLLDGTLEDQVDEDMPLAKGTPGGNASRVVKENKKSTFFDDAMKNRKVEFVEIEGFDYKGQPRRRAADLGSVMRFLNAKTGLTGQDLLGETLSQLALADLKPKFDQMVPGTIRNNAGDVIAQISPAMAKSLREMPTPRTGPTGPTKPYVPAKDGAYVPPSDAEAAHNIDDKLSGKDDPADFEQGPRESPPEMIGPDGQKVSTSGNVFDVSLRSPYAGLLRAPSKAKTPAEKRAAMIDAGHQIGAAELNKLHDNDQMSTKEYTAKIRALAQNPQLAIDYFKRAEKGDFDPAPKVHEARTASDKVQRAPGKAREVVDVVGQIFEMEGATPVEYIELLLASAQDTRLSPKAKQYLKAKRLGMADLKKGWATLTDQDQDAVRIVSAVHKLRSMVDDLPADSPLREAIESDRMQTVYDRVVAAGGKTPNAPWAPVEGPMEVGPTVKDTGPKPKEFPLNKKGEPASVKELMGDGKGESARQRKAREAREADARKPRGAPTDAVQNDDTTQGDDNVPTDDQYFDWDEAEKAPVHDLAKETDLANAMLAAMGITDKVKLLDGVRGPRTKGGTYHRGTRLITLNPNMKGQERIETLMHEIGHHVVWATIAKEVGWDVVAKMSSGAGLDALRIAKPELYDALKADFDAYNAKFKAGQSTQREYLMGRKPLMRSVRASTSMDGRVLGDDFDKFPSAFHEWMADNIAKALTTQNKPKTIIEKFFKNIATALRSLWNKLSPESRKRYTAAKSVDQWVRQMFSAEAMAIREVTGQSAPRAAVEATTRAAAAAASAAVQKYGEPVGPEPPLVLDGDNIDDFKTMVRTMLRPQERQILTRVFSRGAMVTQMREAVNEMHADNPAARDQILKEMDATDEGMESRIAVGYMLWQSGRLRVGPDTKLTLHTLRDDLLAMLGLAGDGEYANTVLSDLADGTVKRVTESGRVYDVRKLVAHRGGPLQGALDRAREVYEKAGVAVGKVLDSQQQRMQDSGIPSLAKLAGIIHKPQGATGNDPGITPAVVDKTAAFMRRADRALAPLSDKQRVTVVQRLQRQLGGATGELKNLDNIERGQEQRDKVAHAIEELRALFDEAYTYMKDAGVDVGERKNFFPIVFDTNNERAPKILRDLYLTKEPDGSYRYEADIRKELERNRPKDEDPAPLEQLVDDLVEGALQEGEAIRKVGEAPRFRGIKHRLSQFVYDKGDPGDIKKFASVQSKHAAEIFARYFEPMIKHAEYTRRLGGGENNRAKFDALIEKMKAEGATEKDIEFAENAVAAAVGAYGADGSPVLKAISPALAERFSGAKTKAAVQGLQAYQNVRLLPLSLLSSLVDPMGIGVRTGGDMKATWEGFKTGIKTIFNKADRAEMLAALEDLGSAQDMLPAMAAGAGFADDRAPAARRVNDFVFKWNGMQSWVQATRFMALRAGHLFLAKHAANYETSDTSRRYLAEMGVEPSDIVVGEDGKVVMNDKVRNALSQFVNSAVLRPHSQQVPQWYNDPYMGLVTQYKGFLYALYEQIGSRIGREINHGNMKVLMPALSYLPVVIMAELLRELIQHGAEGNPRREQWGPTDYTWLGVERSGLMGPKFSMVNEAVNDSQSGRVAGTSLLGPTAGQARNLLSAGEGRRSVAGEIENALPANPLYKNHVNPTELETPA